MSEVPEGWVQDTVMDVAEWGDKEIGEPTPIVFAEEMPDGPEKDERLRLRAELRERIARLG